MSSHRYDHTSTPVGRLARWTDERVAGARLAKSTMRYVFPEHFSFLFGEIALYAFVVLVASGVFLALFYSPGEAEVVYEGSYVPLRGLEVSEAYHSVMDLSFDVRAGLLLRQTHHWAALIFLGAVLAHLARVFFTGAFRKPRELNWITGVTLLALGMVEGFVGYSLLDDLLSGAGLRIAYSTVQSVPVVGTWAAYLIWGGEFPGEGLLARLFAVHIFVLPAAIAGLIAVHLLLIVRNHHTQFPGDDRTEDNVVGLRLWPSYSALSVGLLLLVAGALVLMGGTLQINPVWLYGPYHPYTVPSGAQADWYVLWVQGILRLLPGWVRIEAFGYTVPNMFFSGVLFPLSVFTLLFTWPFLEQAVTGDRDVHHLLDRPRDRPVRTAIGAAALTGFVLLLVVGSDDIIAVTFGWSIVVIRQVERVLIVVLPLTVAAATWKVAGELGARSPLPSSAPQRPAQPRAASGWREWLVTAGTAGAVIAALFDRLRRR